MDNSNFWFYNVKEHCWEHLVNLDNLSHRTSFITVDGTLYAAGGIQKTIEYWQCYDFGLDPDDPFDDEDEDAEPQIKRIDSWVSDQLLMFNVGEKSWYYLTPMSTERHSFPMVYLDGCVYAIGGLDEWSKQVRGVERYNLVKQDWEKVAQLPEYFDLFSAVVYKGKILAYGATGFDDWKSTILVYDPSKDIWETKLSHECFGHFPASDIAATNILFVYKGVCYKIDYFPQDFKTESSIDMPLPTVYALKIGEDVSTITADAEMNQYNLPMNRVGAFQIRDEVFVNMNGFVYKTDIKVTPEQMEEWYEVDLDKWENLIALEDTGMIVNFTFDRKVFGSDD